MTELGSCEAIIQSIKTIVDGSVRISLDLNPTNTDLINKLMNKKLSGQEIVMVGFVDDRE